MKNLFLLLFSFIIILFACKTKDVTHTEPANRYEAEAVPPSEYDKVKSAASAPAPPPVPEPQEVITDDNPPSEVTLEPLDVPDSLLASIERTPCFGTCPTYKLNIYKSGFAEYEGIRFVDSIGKYTGWVSPVRIEQLKEMVRNINYFQFQDEYDNAYITDIPATITIVQMDGKVKRILNRYEGPENLFVFERFLDGIVQDLGYHRWKTRENED